jgi:phage tail-like protein
MPKVTGGTSPKADPFLTFMFSIEGEIDFGSGNKQKLDGYFTEISSPTEEVEVVSIKTVYNEGSNQSKPTSFKLPGRAKKEPITLKRGITKDMTFWKWWKLVKNGDMDKAKVNLTVTMYNRRYEPMVKWDLEKAWPIKVAAPSFSGTSSDFGLEEITLNYKRLKVSVIRDDTDEWDSII